MSQIPPATIQGRTLPTDCLKRFFGWRKSCSGYSANPADWCGNCRKRTRTGQTWLAKQRARLSDPAILEPTHPTRPPN